MGTKGVSSIYCLLIVDDEKHYMDSLADTTPWHCLAIGQVYKAYNAQQAMEMIQSAGIDIVVTDIHMPQMSGVELIEEASKINPGIEFLFLTGYADLHFAKRATELQFKRERKLEVSLAVYKDQIHTLRSNLLLQILSSQHYDNLAEKLRIYDIKVPIGGYAHLSIIQGDKLFQEYDTYSQNLLGFAIVNIMEELFKERYDIWATLDEEGAIVALIYDHSGAPLDGEWVSKHLELFIVYIKYYLKDDVTVISVGEGAFPQELQSVYVKGKDLLRNHRKSTSPYMRTEDEASLFKMLFEPPILTDLLENEQWEEADKKIRNILSGSSSVSSSGRLREVFFFLSNAFLYITNKHGKSLLEMLRPEQVLYFRGKAFVHAGQLEEWALEVLHQFKHGLEEVPANRYDSVVKKIQEFILSNLDKDLSLTMVAEQVYLHPNYLSKIFKQLTTHTVSQYIYYQRMEKAAMLLKQSDDKIYQIGFQVGYSNTNWFIKKFKEYYQTTPQEYRRLSR